MNNSIEIFLSYSHRDEELKEELVKHLTGLRRNGFIKEWHDRCINAGKDWVSEIDEHLNSSKIILLLISSDFLNSEYCNIELKCALERNGSGDSYVIPIILRPVYWKSESFSKLQVLPSDGKPVTSWDNRDEAFLNIIEGIRSCIEELTNLRRTDTNTNKDLLKIDDKKVTQKKELGGGFRETSKLDLIVENDYVGESKKKWWKRYHLHLVGATIFLFIFFTFLFLYYLPSKVQPSIDILLCYENSSGAIYPLLEGSHLKTGDGYCIFLKPNVACYLYAYQVDSRGNVYRLFPNQKYNTKKIRFKRRKRGFQI